MPPVQTVAPTIGSIYAQNINYRLAVKDQIKDYIMKTELAAIDPDIMDQRRRTIAALEKQILELDKLVGDLREGKIRADAKLVERFTAGTLQREVAALQGAARVQSQAIATAGSLKAAEIRAEADLRKARAANETTQRIAALQANSGASSRAAEAEAQGNEGRNTLSSAITDIAFNKAWADPNNAADEFSADLKTLWQRDYAPRFAALSGNKVGQDQFIKNFIGDANLYVSSLEPTQRAALEADLSTIGMDPSALALGAAEVRTEDFTDAAIAERKKQKLKDEGFTEVPGYNGLNTAISAGGLPSATFKAPPPTGPTEPTRNYRLGIPEGEEALKQYSTSVAYNKALLEDKLPQDESGRPIAFEAFVDLLTQENGQGPISDSVNFAANLPIDEAKALGDNMLVENILRRRGLETEVAKARKALVDSFENLPSYETIERKTLETYSKLYGSAPQRALVQLAEQAQRIKFPVLKDGKLVKDAEGNEVIAVLDAPDLLNSTFGKVAGGKADLEVLRKLKPERNKLIKEPKPIKLKPVPEPIDRVGELPALDEMPERESPLKAREYGGFDEIEMRDEGATIEGAAEGGPQASIRSADEEEAFGIAEEVAGMLEEYQGANDQRKAELDAQFAQVQERAKGLVAKRSPQAAVAFIPATPKPETKLSSTRQTKEALEQKINFGSNVVAGKVLGDRVAGQKTKVEDVMDTKGLSIADKETIKKLAESPGRISTEELVKTLRRVLGRKAEDPNILALARQLFAVYEQLA